MHGMLPPLSLLSPLLVTDTVREIAAADLRESGSAQMPGTIWLQGTLAARVRWQVSAPARRCG